MDTQNNALGIGIDYFNLSIAHHRARQARPDLCYFCGKAAGNIGDAWTGSKWHPPCITEYIRWTDLCPICEAWRATEEHRDDRPCAYADYLAWQDQNEHNN